MRRSLGLEIGAALRWVELEEARGRVTFRNSGSAALTEAETSATLRALVGQRRWRGREVVVSLPRAAATLRWLSLPAASREETGGMVELEAAQSLPFSAEEAGWDFLSFPGKDGRQEVLLVAARRLLIQEQRRIVEGAGLRVGAVSVDPLAVTTLYRAALPETEEGALLVHLDGKTATLSCVHGDRLLLSRSVTLEGTDAEALAMEVRRTLVAGALSAQGAVGGGSPTLAGSEGNGARLQVGAIWLTGEGADEDLARGLAAVAETGPIRVAALPRSALPGGEEGAPALDTALGLALLGLRPAPERLDLARQVRPATPTGTPGPARRARLLAGLAAVAASAFLLLAIPRASKRELAAASRAQADARRLGARRRQMEERARLLRRAVTPAHSYLDVLNDVSAQAGREVWLTQFAYDRGRPIVIRGAARSNVAVARLVEGLRNSRHLERVALGSATRSEGKGTSFVQFTITGSLRGDAPLEAKRRSTAGYPRAKRVGVGRRGA